MSWVLQEATKPDLALLRQTLQSRYPYSVGDWGIVIFSKHPIVAEGRVDRPGYPPWISLMIRRAQIEMNGTTFELAGIHLVRPFYPALQQQDIAALIAFVQGRSLPLVMAGDFNMSPWTEKLQRFEHSSGLRRKQHLPSHLADGAGHIASPAAGRHRPRVRLAAICGGWRNGGAAARFRSSADRGRSGTDQT